MSDVVAELATRVKISDPKPARCAACFCSADANVRFVDFDAAIDRGTFIDPGGAGAVLDSIDELHLCEACVRSAGEVLDVKPALHARQLREIKRLELENEHWRDTARRAQAELNRQLESGLGEPAPRTKR